MPLALASEPATVQGLLVRYAGAIGWEIVSRDCGIILRKGEGGMFFYNLLEETLLKFNPGIKYLGLTTPRSVRSLKRRSQRAEQHLPIRKQEMLSSHHRDPSHFFQERQL